jgi:uncharacterized protein (TIGR03435 family)
MKSFRVPAVVAMLAIAGSATAIVAQGPAPAGTSRAPAFDVVSVKRTPPGSPQMGALSVPPGQAAVRPGGRLAAPSNTVRNLVRIAYGVQDLQIAGGPAWVASDRFDVEATTRPDVKADEARAMLRALLEERFKLAVHREMREMTVTTLEPARSDKRPGPQLRASGPDCAPPTPPPNVPVPPPPPPPPGTAASLILSNQTPTRCVTINTPWHMSLRETTMPQLAIRLTALLGRLVVDRTGLPGLHDLDLTFAPDPGTPPPMVNGAPLVIDAPALPTALRDQLGLKLESSKAPVDVVVIDRVEAPTEN